MLMADNLKLSEPADRAPKPHSSGPKSESPSFFQGYQVGSCIDLHKPYKND